MPNVDGTELVAAGGTIMIGSLSGKKRKTKTMTMTMTDYERVDMLVEDAVLRSNVRDIRSRSSEVASRRLLARAIGFASLILAGVGVLGVIEFGHMHWLYPTCAYAVAAMWAHREFA